MVKKDKIKNISIYDIFQIDLKKINCVTNNINLVRNINGLPSQEHYRLLCYLSTLVNNTTIYELGTYQGASALCLAYNKSNYVISYDVVHCIEVERQPNIEFRLGDYKKDSNIINSPLIFIDVTHDGVLEQEIYDYLSDNNYKGITVWDDILLNREMINFWGNVKREKIDLTHVGHFSGTGVIVFE